MVMGGLFGSVGVSVGVGVGVGVGGFTAIVSVTVVPLSTLVPGFTLCLTTVPSTAFGSELSCL
jgi:hypothetical protein